MLTDHLLDLWRRAGTDPGLVLRAAEQASCGLSNAESVVTTQMPSNAAVGSFVKNRDYSGEVERAPRGMDPTRR